MKKLKLFFACLLMAVLSIGQVWASNPAVDDVIFKEEFGGNNIQASAYTFTGTTTWSGSTTGLSYASTSTSSLLSNATANPITSDNFFFVKTSASTLTMSGIAIPSNVTEVTVSFQSNKTIVNCTYSFTGGDDYATGATSISGVQTFDIDCTDESTLYLKFTKTGTSSNARIDNVTVTVKAVSGGGSDPSLSVTPTSWDFGEVAVSDEASKVFSVSGSNLTAGTLSISVPEGFSVSPSSISVTEATLAATNVTVSKNTNTIDDYSGNLSISGCGLSETKTVALEMSVVADPEPTGTFELFSGDLAEGDYVFVVDAKAMTNSVSSSRLANTNVTIATDQITNPDESIIWHVAASGDYWTIYNAAVEKYAASNGTKNQAALTATEDDKILWSVDKSGNAFNFENKYNAANSVNAKLQRNGDYGWACYASYSNISLYKKQVAGQPKAPTFSIPGGNYETAQSVELSCETQGAKIYYTLDGSKPSSTSTEYSTAIPVSATTTIKAVAIKDDIESTVASATYTIVVWQTVDEIWSSITSEGPTNANVWGYVSQANVGGYNNNYYISVDGSLTANQLEIYKGDNAGNTVAVGDKVHVNGDLTIFNEIKEFKQNTGVIVHYAAKGALQSVAVDGTPTKTEYAANETFDPAGLKVYGTYANGFVGEITEGITWGNDLTDGKVTESTTVHVTATVSEVPSPAYDVAVTVAAKTLVSIAVGTDAYTIYTGEALPQPVVTATFSEGEPENVSAFAVYDSESVFDTEVIDDPDPQTITVSYTFGGETKTATYTVSVKDYANADDAPYTVTEALHIITAAIGNTESAREIVVTGTVSEENISNNKNRYKISDSTNELLVYAGKGFNNENFTNTNYPKVGDVVKVKGKVINYNNNTPEFASGKSYLLSQVRPATIAIENVASFEVGATDLTESDLDITTPSDGDITFVSGDDAVATIEANAIHAVAPGTVTITANLAATENDDALNYAAASTTFDVTVIAATVKYAISFDGNGGSGDAPEFAVEAAAGAELTLPANTYTKTDKLFGGWKVINNTTSEEVEVTAGAFTMPASAVTIQAQWADPSVWALTYTSNLELKGNSGTKSYAEKVKIPVEEVLTEFDALRACTGSAAGSCTVKVPAATQKLHFHAAAWNAKTSTITVTMGETELLVQALEADAGIKNSSPYTLEGIPYEYYYCIDLSSYTISEETTITFSAGSDKRFVLFGVNQEGGVVPVLDHIAITGTMTNTTGWKTGDEITPEGLTVNAYYTLNEVMQDPVNVTSSVVWSHAALVKDQTEVTLTATYTDGVAKSANVNVTIEAVETGDPTIITDPTSYLNFGASVEKDAVVAPKTITVTLKNIAGATATLGGTNYSAFSIDDTEIVDGDVITVSVNTGTPGVYAGTVTIKDNDSETEKVINLSMTVLEPEVPETAVSTTSEWVAATDGDLVNGAEVLIVGVHPTTSKVYAAGEQGGNNRAAVEASVDGEGVLTPGDNTMSFILEAQEGGKFALRTSTGKYLCAASSGSNYLRTQDVLDDNGKWTLTTTSAVANGSYTRNTMFFNSSSSLFACYASSTTTQQPIAFYVPKPAQKYSVTYAANGGGGDAPAAVEYEEGETFTVAAADLFTAPEGKEFDKWNDGTNDYAPGATYTVGTADVVLTAYWKDAAPEPVYTDIRTGLTAGNYFTVCWPKEMTAIKGATLWSFAGKDDDMVYLIQEEAPFAAGKPFIAYATSEKLEAVVEGDDAAAGSYKGLHGTLVDMTNSELLAAGATYMLKDNALRPVGGGHLDANRAYVILSEITGGKPANVPAHKVRSMPMQKDAATGFENIESGDAPMKVMIEGTMYILRGEKVYDATGRLVK